MGCSTEAVFREGRAFLCVGRTCCRGIQSDPDWKQRGFSRPDEGTAGSRGPARRSGNPFVDYIYGHFDVFRLLLCCAGGSSYEHYMDDLVDILERSTRHFMEATGHEAVINGKKAGEKTVHILISSYLYGLFEPVAHEMEKVEAITYVNELKYFFDVGWADILSLK